MTTTRIPPRPTPSAPAGTLLSVRDGVVAPVAQGAPASAGQAYTGGPGGGQVNIVQMVMRIYRGRVLITAALAAVAGITGAVAGFMSQRPEYRAEAIVTIRAVIPNAMMGNVIINPLYEARIRSEAKILQSDRVLQRAMASDDWRELSRPTGPRAQARFASSLEVSTGWDSPEQIFVTFTDEDAEAAFRGVRSVVAAYEEVNRSQEEKIDRVTTEELQERRNNLESQIADKNAQIDAAAAPFGTRDLEPIVRNWSEELGRLTREISDLEARLPEAEQQEKGGFNALDRAGRAEEIARQDPRMAELVRQRDQLQGELNLMDNQGFGPKHPTLLQVRGALNETLRQIDERIATWKPPAGAPAPNGPAGGVDPGLGLSAQQIGAQLTERREKRDRRESEVRKLGEALKTIDDLRKQINSHQTDLDLVRRRLDEVRSESRVEDALGIIDIIRPENPPSSPSSDRRRKMGALGLIAGAGLPVVLVGLIGLIDRRFRYSDQARDGFLNTPLLGVLPEVPKDLKDPEEVAAAAHCVHQVRALLQVARPGSKVFVVTSATAGDGKTSLTQSLAMSFAAAGEKTLAVDLDLVGQGLSIRSKLKPEMGVIEALEAGEVAPYATPSGVENLWVLPIVDEEAGSASSLSEHQLHTLVEKAREAFDVVLIDTGPALGSLESNLVGPLADGVVIVIGRGQQEILVQRSIEHLQSLGSRVLGIVFNRAKAADFHSSVTSTSFRSVRARSQKAASVGRGGQDPSATVAETIAMDVKKPRSHLRGEGPGPRGG
jgi:polysaccharide biosynthesis transport protein